MISDPLNSRSRTYNTTNTSKTTQAKINIYAIVKTVDPKSARINK